MTDNYQRKNALKKLLKALVDFEKQMLTQPPIGGSLIYSVFDTKTVIMYYKLRKLLRNTIKERGVIRSYIRKLPLGTWLLRKYLYESVLFISLIILFYFYMVKLPIFRGKLAFFVGLFFLIWYLTRVMIIDLDRKITLTISKLIELIKGELSLIKFLEDPANRSG